MTGGRRCGNQPLRGHALDRLFACRIDRRDHDRVGIVEAAGEFLEEARHAAVAVRLVDGDDAA